MSDTDRELDGMTRGIVDLHTETYHPGRPCREDAWGRCDAIAWAVLPGDTPAVSATPAVPTGNRAQLVREALFYDAVGERAQTFAAERREALEADARGELAANGGAPTWRFPGVTVPLAMTRDSVVVVDRAAYAKWMAEHYPTEVELRVRDSFDKAFRAGLVKRGDPPCDKQGEVIPGLQFVPGGVPKGISIRATDEAKAGAAAAAAAYLDAMPPLTAQPLT